jgi:hypothetical protein
MIRNTSCQGIAISNNCYLLHVPCTGQLEQKKNAAGDDGQETYCRPSPLPAPDIPITPYVHCKKPPGYLPSQFVLNPPDVDSKSPLPLLLLLVYHRRLPSSPVTAAEY